MAGGQQRPQGTLKLNNGKYPEIPALGEETERQGNSEHRRSLIFKAQKHKGD